MDYCLNCGNEIKRKRKQKDTPRKYCSEACRREHQGWKTFGTAVCQYCGKQFKEKRDRANKYCSKECSNKGQRQEAQKIKEQEQQRVEAIQEEYNRLLEEHKRIIARLEELQNRIEREKSCIVCGQPFVWRTPKQICCSPECSKKHRNRDKDRRIYRNGKPDLSITLTKLYMRDGGVCQICGRQINFDCDSNSDFYPSIDHIQPLAKGGLHSWDNVQLACRVCNTFKRDKTNDDPAPKKIS